jgi:hypothetical protein
MCPPLPPCPAATTRCVTAVLTAKHYTTFLSLSLFQILVQCVGSADYLQQLGSYLLKFSHVFIRANQFELLTGRFENCGDVSQLTRIYKQF